MNTDNPLKPSAMTKTQLAAAYGICAKTFNKWIKPYIEEIGARQDTYLYTPEQVKIIYEKLGEP